MNTGHRLIPKEELHLRMSKFLSEMERSFPDWEMAVISSDINIFYFTGTLQYGLIVIRRECEPVFWVRNSFERAMLESRFQNIRPMPSFKTAAAEYSHLPDTIYLEKTKMSLSWFEMFSKHFKFTRSVAVDRVLQKTRSVKTDLELSYQRTAGHNHRILLEEKVPLMLKEGISEAELGGEIFNEAMKLGHHGVSRFSGDNGDLSFGYVSFSESGLYPVNFDSPDGNIGVSIATPYIGSCMRRLKKGDMVFVDIGFGYEGYNTDKTFMYSFGKKPYVAVSDTHKRCAEILFAISEKLTVGSVPSEIYDSILSGLDEKFLENFMGYKDRKVKFLGHGIGLYVDEYPAIARGFNEPLQKNMTIAIEPKCGMDGYGTVGVEETFAVTEENAECLTALNPRIIEI